jgi:hypothetical protein
LFDSDDKKLEALWNKLYPLKEFTDPSNFKSYDELKKKVNTVLGSNIRDTSTDDSTVEDDIEEPISPKPSSKKKSSPEPDDDMDAMSYLEKLANE